MVQVKTLLYRIRYLLLVNIILLYDLSYCQQLETFQVYSLINLGDENRRCGMVVGTVTVINCTSSTYLMRTASVLRDSTQVKNSSLVLSQNVVAIQQSFESQFVGAVSYLINNQQLERSFLDGNNNIQRVLIAQFTFQSSQSVMDISLTDKFVMVQYSNYAFQLFILPTLLGGQPVTTANGYLDLSPDNPENLFSYFFSFGNITDQKFQFLYTPNWSKQDNYLYQYDIFVSQTGITVNDVAFQSVSKYNLRTTRVSSMGVTQNLLVIGCQYCQSYQGQIDIYQRPNLNKIYTFVGSTGNRQFGYDLMIIQRDDYTTIYINSNNLATIKQYYINVIKVLRNPTTGTYSIQIIEKAVDLSSTVPAQGGLLLGIYKQQVLFKFNEQPGLYSLTTCDYTNYYTTGTGGRCDQCPSTYDFTLTVQQTSCNQCSSLYNSRNVNDFLQAVYQQKCLSYVPPIVNNGTTNNGTLGGGGNTTNNSTNGKGNQTGDGSSNDGRDWKIAIGIVIPIVVIVLIIGLVILIKKKGCPNIKLPEIKFKPKQTAAKKEKDQEDPPESKDKKYQRKPKKIKAGAAPGVGQQIPIGLPPNFQNVGQESQSDIIQDMSRTDEYKIVENTDREAVRTKETVPQMMNNVPTHRIPVEETKSNKDDKKKDEKKKDKKSKKDKKKPITQSEIFLQMQQAEMKAQKQYKKKAVDEEQKNHTFMEISPPDKEFEIKATYEDNRSHSIYDDGIVEEDDPIDDHEKGIRSIKKSRYAEHENQFNRSPQKQSRTELSTAKKGQSNAKEFL